VSPAASITVARRFRGPERSGNGGYTAGLLARCLSGGPGSPPVTVTLRRPPPLDVAMTVVSVASGDAPAVLELWHDGSLVATSGAGAFDAEPVAAVGFESATAARSAYAGLRSHPFPGCFACGPAREPGDGLRLAPGLVGPGRTACVWMPDPSLAAEDDAAVAGAEFVWAALDCPGGWTSDLEARPLVLGRMTAQHLELPKIGLPHVVVGERLGEDGRKTFTATSLYDGDRLVARAEHTWLAVDPAMFNT
jgi:hypothetical protein